MAAIDWMKKMFGKPSSSAPADLWPHHFEGTDAAELRRFMQFDGACINEYQDGNGVAIRMSRYSHTRTADVYVNAVWNRGPLHQGLASKAMRLITSEADRAHRVLTLTVGPMAPQNPETLNKDALFIWYGKFGFVRQNSVWEFSSDMLRQPRRRRWRLW